MQKFFSGVIKYKKTIIVVFILVGVLCVLLSRGVGVNYDMMDYMPDSTPSMIGLEVIEDEFESSIPNAQIMAPDVSIAAAMEIKDKLENVDGINDVIWLDDATDIYVPLNTQDQKLVVTYYKENTALFFVNVDSSKGISALAQAREIIGPGCAMKGSVVNTSSATQTSKKELSRLMMFVIPLCFIILLLTTSSYIEPVLFLATIGIAILINNGTNIIFGEISFVTNAAASILQLAVSIDYSIFLLHRFSDFRNEGLPADQAMIMALKKSFGSIAASGLTTAIGFAALILMRFKIGADMGIVMAKAIVISMISVLVLLPVLALVFRKLIDKTHHRPFMPSFKKFGKAVYKLRIPATVIAIVVLIPCILAQQNNSFLYGSSRMLGEKSQGYEEQMLIEDKFGQTNQMVLLVEKKDISTEKNLSDDLKKIDEITGVISYSQTVGSTIPKEFLDEDTVRNFDSENYSRIILTISTAAESEHTFTVIEQIKSMASQYYGDGYYLVGDSAGTYDMKQVVTVDMLKVNLIAVAAVFLVLLLSFRSFSLPFVLVLVIEASIWINLSIPYFTGTSMFFMVYLIISSVQLGATVDYAILFANRYLEERRQLDKKQALFKTVSKTTLSILTSASLLTLGGAMLGLTSSNMLLRQMGFTLARGAVFSAILVLFLLPALLYMFDKLIAKTTLGLKDKLRKG